jgi:thymidylate synthase
MDWEYAYHHLTQTVIETGYKSSSRAGDTRSLPGQVIRIPLYGNFPLLTTRKMYPQGVIGELAGFVRGAEDLATYEKFGCSYWTPNAATWPKNFGKQQSEWSIGRCYGSLWRNFNGIDQLASTISAIRNDPNSRRHVITSWCPGAEAALPSCHILMQFYVRERGLTCVVYMRSVDLCVGLPSDIVLYALLTKLIAKDTGLSAEELVFCLGDCHVYENHVETFKEHNKQKPLQAPILILSPEATTLTFTPEMVELVDYFPRSPIKYAFNV